MIRPRISAIVPAYNVERYIDEALDSLLTQTEAFDEIIVINDGSTDGTAARLERYAGYPNLRIHTTSNHGLGPARNTGIQLAKGDYLYFFDSDDVLDRTFVASMRQEIESTPDLDLLFFSGKMFFDGDFSGAFTENLQRRMTGLFPTGLDAAAALHEAGGFINSACMYLSRAELWRRGLRFMPIYAEDGELIPRLCAAAGRTRVLDIQPYHRRIRAGSLMTMRFTAAHAAGCLRQFDSLCDVYLSLDGSPHQDFIRKYLIDVTWSYLRTSTDARIAPELGHLWDGFRRIGWVPKRIFQNTVFPDNVIYLLRIAKLQLLQRRPMRRQT